MRLRTGKQVVVKNVPAVLNWEHARDGIAFPSGSVDGIVTEPLALIDSEYDPLASPEGMVKLWYFCVALPIAGAGHW